MTPARASTRYHTRCNRSTNRSLIRGMAVLDSFVNKFPLCGQLTHTRQTSVASLARRHCDVCVFFLSLEEAGCGNAWQSKKQGFFLAFIISKKNKLYGMRE